MRLQLGGLPDGVRHHGNAGGSGASHQGQHFGYRVDDHDIGHAHGGAPRFEIVQLCHEGLGEERVPVVEADRHPVDVVPPPVSTLISRRAASPYPVG